MLRAACLAKVRATKMEDILRVSTHQLERVGDNSTIFAPHITSYHIVQYRLTVSEQFWEVAHAYDIPIIADAPSESDMYGLTEHSVNLVCINRYKLLAEPSFGIRTERIYVIEGSITSNGGIIYAIASGGAEACFEEGAASL